MPQQYNLQNYIIKANYETVNKVSRSYTNSYILYFCTLSSGQQMKQELLDKLNKMSYKCMYPKEHFNDVQMIPRFKKLREWAYSKGFSSKQVSDSITIAASKNKKNTI